MTEDIIVKPTRDRGGEAEVHTRKHVPGKSDYLSKANEEYEERRAQQQIAENIS